MRSVCFISASTKTVGFTGCPIITPKKGVRPLCRMDHKLVISSTLNKLIWGNDFLSVKIHEVL